MVNSAYGGIHPDRGGIVTTNWLPSSSLTRLVPTLSFTVVPVSPHPSHCVSSMMLRLCGAQKMADAASERMRRASYDTFSCVGACAIYAVRKIHETMAAADHSHRQGSRQMCSLLLIPWKADMQTWCSCRLAAIAGTTGKHHNRNPDHSAQPQQHLPGIWSICGLRDTDNSTTRQLGASGEHHLPQWLHSAGNSLAHRVLAQSSAATMW